MDALGIESAIVAGFDWGARSANVVAALWPHRCKAMVSVSGYLIGNPEVNKTPLPPPAELSWWYQFYFATERGRAGYDKYRHDFAKLIWHTASPKWNFDDETFDRSAACVRQRRPRRHRDPQLPVAARAGARRVAVRRPRAATRHESGHHGAHDHPRRRRQRLRPTRTRAPTPTKFSGKYTHRTISGGVGHNLPQEAPERFVEAVIEVDGC